tara:strand:+ start:4864 stop:5199 length:336 start_codon:yes stop_codon:yes gene_type:complete
MSTILKPGSLCTIRVTGLAYTQDGFATVGSAGLNSTVQIFEKIDLHAYPSCNDFLGKSTAVSDNDIVTVIRHVGRPFKVIKDPSWFQYDVYDIFVKGAVRQIFRQNLRLVK